SSRSAAQPDRENGAAKRYRPDSVQSTSDRARSAELSRDRATRNSRAVVHRRLAAERNNFVAHFAGGRSCASRAADLGSDVAVTADFARSTTTNSTGSAQSCDAALARAH